MRFLYKRPRLKDVREELTVLLEVMMSDSLVYLDLFVFSFIFTAMLFPFIQSVILSVFIFVAFYSFFVCLYQFVFCKFFKKDY